MEISILMMRTKLSRFLPSGSRNPIENTMTTKITQFGLAASFLSGLCDDEFTFKKIAEHGDFGHGTFNAIDGEMIAVDGVFYRADVDGNVAVVQPDQVSPLAVVTHFKPNSSCQLENIADFATFQSQIAQHMPKKNTIYAIRVDATFTFISARSELPQTKPYESIEISIPKLQRSFLLENTQGSLIGYYVPEIYKSIILPGFHFHYINTTRNKGGHVFDFKFKQGTIRLQACTELHVMLPITKQFDSMDLNQNTDKALQVAKQGRAGSHKNNPS